MKWHDRTQTTCTDSHFGHDVLSLTFLFFMDFLTKIFIANVTYGAKLILKAHCLYDVYLQHVHVYITTNIWILNHC